MEQNLFEFSFHGIHLRRDHGQFQDSFAQFQPSEDQWLLADASAAFACSLNSASILTRVISFVYFHWIRFTKPVTHQLGPYGWQRVLWTRNVRKTLTYVIEPITSMIFIQIYS